jgi:tetratricopeptide (TPR) repeat protein
MGRRTRRYGAALLVACLSAPLRAQESASRARTLDRRASELDRQGNAAAALPLLWEAAGLAPTNGDIQDHLGAALERMGALDAAVGAYRAAASAHPPARAATRHLVLALAKAGRSAEAIALARAGVASTSADADAWFTLGLAQADVDGDGAVDSFRHALAVDPRYALARYNLALVLLHADRLPQAIDELRRALTLTSTAELHYTLGVACWRLGNLDEASAELRAAVEADGAFADAYLARGSVLQARGDLKGSAAALARAIALRPALPAPHIVLAQTLARAGDDAGARRETAEAERLRLQAQRSQEAATLTAAGTQTMEAGDAAAAADCFRRAIAAFEAFAPAHYQLGRALEVLGRHGEARAAFARARQLNPALVPPR